mgnify:CR=1 FL=1
MEQQLLQDLSEANPQTPLAYFGAKDFVFECAKQKGLQLITRLTTRPLYTLDISGDKAVEQCNEPSLQKSTTALHMGAWSDRPQNLSAGVRGGNALYYLDGSLVGTLIRQAPYLCGSDLGRWNNSVLLARAFVVEHLLMSTHKKTGLRPAFSMIQRSRSPTVPLRPPCGRCQASQMLRQILAP